jgi:hypothetical protein
MDELETSYDALKKQKESGGNSTYAKLLFADACPEILRDNEGARYDKFRTHEFSMLNADGTAK